MKRREIKTIIQPQPYIEDGWFIEVMDLPDHPIYSVYWIPQHGGQDQHIRDFGNKERAIAFAKALT